MAKCEKCGAKKRSWPGSCPRCRDGKKRATVAETSAEMAVAGGALTWVWRGVMTAVRSLIRVFT
ncbi:hypothetical protein [Streptomyces otsuchiensis]|uniref:hypothetical protein n=1 Tax=Streptomyces otsuchiensis TaxID=2681388 RepID=UPI0010314861|nr:hypothetical protein [Streptomyces otsuchiensis]